MWVRKTDQHKAYLLTVLPKLSSRTVASRPPWMTPSWPHMLLPRCITRTADFRSRDVNTIGATENLHRSQRGEGQSPSLPPILV